MYHVAPLMYHAPHLIYDVTPSMYHVPHLKYHVAHMAAHTMHVPSLMLAVHRFAGISLQSSSTVTGYIMSKSRNRYHPLVLP